MLIEQAIFTSAETDRLSGYQVVAHSPGVVEDDLRELSVWGPSHDSLLETGADAVSVNFHPLPSGAFCVSQTTPAGDEYSSRGGPRIYTQCLIVPPAVLARFANNAFALLNAAFAQGTLRIHDPLPNRLEPFRLGGKAAVLDQALLLQLLSDPGATWLGAVVEAAVTTPCLALAAGPQRGRLLAGLINCLPPECRTQFSFTTGLKHSPRRPFHILCTGADQAEQRRLWRQYEIMVLELPGKPPAQFTVANGWSGFVASAIAAGQMAFLGQQLSLPRPKLSAADLNALGDQLLEELAGRVEAAAMPDPAAAGAARPAAMNHAPSPLGPRSFAADELIERERRADAPHRHPNRAGETAPTRDAPTDVRLDPSQILARHCPAALEKLELLDDAVFEAIAGKPGALEQVQALWPEVLSQVGPELVEESRTQYVRHALRVWRECVEDGEIRNPALAVSAIEIVCLLVGDDSRG